MLPRRYLMTLAGGVLLAVSAMAYPASASNAAHSASRQVSQSAPTMIPALPEESVTASGPTGLLVTVDGVELGCFNVDSGIVYAIASNNIHIWNKPGGHWLYSIPRKSWFDSGWMIDNKGPYHCLTYGSDDNQFWVYGFRNADTKDVGFVGLNYVYIQEFYS
jgi:hypothetical protein